MGRRADLWRGVVSVLLLGCAGGGTDQSPNTTLVPPMSGGSESTAATAESTSDGDTTDSTGGSESSVPTGTDDPLCGDGIVDADEDCDDGPANADDAACTSACRSAVCGDGLVQTGVEACDDGNQIDADACSNTCTAGSGCGDGVMQPEEACDDGNTADDDECTGACQLAVCGDGFVRAGVEACDDGNQIDDDACSNACTAADGCGDGVLGGAETGVDCGGPTCPACAEGNPCVLSSDCLMGVCTNNVCAAQMTRWSDGTMAWPDQACNAGSTFGNCDTNAQDHADAWATAVCAQNGYSSGVWTGNKEDTCGGEISMYCQGLIPCSPLFEATCIPGDQTRVELTCFP